MSNGFKNMIGDKERHGGHLKRLKIMNKDRLDALNKIIKIKNKMEFFNIENFPDKTYTYQLFFNLVRPDTYKENKTPWDIVKEKNMIYQKKIVCFLRLFLTI
ncbi:MAG: hypothetical protein KA120_06020 [Candidatus Goldbacteria bacterium]|nr:hypothetical protein [Candidatus Goldiibacteriota bacterium]